MFKVGQDVVLKDSSQNKVMSIQAYNDEFIRAYWSKGEYSFAHESNFRHATPQEIALGHRIESCKCVVTRTYENGTCNKCGMQDIADCEILDHPEDYTSPNCKKYDERVK